MDADNWDIGNADGIVETARNEEELKMFCKLYKLNDNPYSHQIFGSGVTIEKRYGKFLDDFK